MLQVPQEPMHHSGWNASAVAWFLSSGRAQHSAAPSRRINKVDEHEWSGPSRAGSLGPAGMLEQLNRSLLCLFQLSQDGAAAAHWVFVHDDVLSLQTVAAWVLFHNTHNGCVVHVAYAMLFASTPFHCCNTPVCKCFMTFLQVRFKLHVVLHAISCASVVLQGIQMCTAEASGASGACHMASLQRLAVATCAPSFLLYLIELRARTVYLQMAKV